MHTFRCFNNPRMSKHACLSCCWGTCSAQNRWCIAPYMHSINHLYELMPTYPCFTVLQVLNRKTCHIYIECNKPWLLSLPGSPPQWPVLHSPSRRTMGHRPVISWLCHPSIASTSLRNYLTPHAHTHNSDRIIYTLQTHKLCKNSFYNIRCRKSG